MNRRRFLQSAVGLPFLGLGKETEIRADLEINQSTAVHMIIAAFSHEMSAESFRQGWIGHPFETRGEWYVMESRRRQLPSHLAGMPGTLTWHATLMGEAAGENEYLVGAFRRNHIGCIVRIRENDEALMHSIAELIAAENIPGIFETSWSPAQLHRLIPDENSLGQTVEPGNSFWP